MVNLHFSLLPRWRGAAPVERAILAGDPVTGVSLMALEAGLDTGPVYARQEVVVAEGETAEQLRGRLVEVGGALLVELLSGPLPAPVPQEGEPTYAEKLTPADLELHWDRPADELLRVVRLGRAWTTFRGRRLGVLAAEVATTAPRGAARDGGRRDRGHRIGSAQAGRRPARGGPAHGGRRLAARRPPTAGGAAVSWDPDLYDRFEAERAQPFSDLLALCRAARRRDGGRPRLRHRPAHGRAAPGPRRLGHHRHRQLARDAGPGPP